MRIELVDGLPFVSVVLVNQKKTVTLHRVLIDTGSAGTAIPIDTAIELCLGPDWEDELIRIRGIGGTEFVYLKDIDTVAVGSLVVHNLRVEVSTMDYGFEVNGILGTDFFIDSKAVIDLNNFELRNSQPLESSNN